MLIFKIFRADEWQALERDGDTAGAPIDIADGYIHFSTASQAAETAAKHFAGAEGLVLAAVDADTLGDALRWEPSRGDALFPHLYRRLRRDQVLWHEPLPLDGGRHRFPAAMAWSFLERLGLALLRRTTDPETAHDLALKALNAGLTPHPGPVTSPRLATTLAGLDLPNPVGLAAGFDKNAIAVAPLTQSGFGFVEVGAATPRPQPGNPKPRLFRLTEDRAAINRFGFNNDGAAAIAARLAEAERRVPVGLNLGANKDSADRARDYAEVLRTAGPHIDFATVNVSSPNTERLRDLQGAAALSSLLAGVAEARDALPRRIPVFLKIAPDLDADEISAIAAVALRGRVDAVIATNTTLARPGLKSPQRGEAGGLSGAPLFEKSTRVLAQLSRETGGRLPLIGVGGVASAGDAYAKIRAGASALQLYTAMVFDGLSMIPPLIEGLDALLARDGHACVADAVGTGRDAWL